MPMLATEAGTRAGDKLALLQSINELALYRLLFAAVKDYGIFIIDPQGYVVTWNAGAALIKGYSAEEIIGQSFTCFYPLDAVRAGKPQQELELAATNGRFEDESWRLRKDGSAFWANDSVTALRDKDGRLLGFSRIIRDVTERQRQQADVDLNRLKIVASAQALGTMAGGIAHEINNPLAVVHALACDLTEATEQGAVTLDEVAKTMRRITQYTERIAKIVKSLRSIGREGDKDPFEEAPVSRIVEQALDLCRERFKEHSIELLTAPIATGLSITCREVQLSQILINLLQNAFDAAQANTGKKWVRLAVAADGDTLVLSVSDSGKGVPPELKQRIMDAFFTTKPIGKGTGLGLSLSKRMAEEHGGTLALIEMSYSPRIGQ